MNWEDKFALLKQLNEGLGPGLMMRRPGEWYVGGLHAEIKQVGLLYSPTQAATTPEGAVEECWRQYTELGHGEYVVIGAYSDGRRAVRWDGVRWARVREAVPR